MSLCPPYSKLPISCQSLDHTPPPPIFNEDLHFPVSTEWKQHNWNLRTCHTVNFSGSSVHMGIFKEPLIVLNPEIFPWICDFHLQWSTVSMNCSVGVSLSRGRSLPAFPNLWRNKWNSCLWGGFLSLLVSSEKKSYPAVSVRTALPPFLWPFPTRMKKSAENHS